MSDSINKHTPASGKLCGSYWWVVFLSAITAIFKSIDLNSKKAAFLTLSLSLIFLVSDP